jgi:hypothetical protein
LFYAVGSDRSTKQHSFSPTTHSVKGCDLHGGMAGERETNVVSRFEIQGLVQI